MNERFGPNTFERLAQGSRTRDARITALNPVNTGVVTEGSRTFEKTIVSNEIFE